MVKELPLIRHGSDTSNVPLTAVNVDSAGSAYVIDNNRVFYHSRDDGLTWDSISTLMYSFPHSLLFTSLDSGFVAFENGIEFTQDGGRTWTQQFSTGDGPFIKASTFYQNGNGYAVGEMGAIWSYQPGSSSIRRFAGPEVGSNLVVDGRGIRYRVDSRLPVEMNLVQMNGVLVASLSQGLQNPGVYYVPLPSNNGTGPWVVDVSIGKSRYRRLITNLPK